MCNGTLSVCNSNNRIKYMVENIAINEIKTIEQNRLFLRQCSYFFFLLEYVIAAATLQAFYKTTRAKKVLIRYTKYYIDEQTHFRTKLREVSVSV